MAVLSELHASIVPASSKEKLLAESDLVVVGSVEGKESYRQDFYFVNDVDGREFLSEDQILTDWKIHVLETLKGQCPESIMKVTTLGGTVDGLTETWSFDVSLKTDEIALFFLVWNQRNEKWIPPGAKSRVFLIEEYGSSNKLKASEGISVVLAPDEMGVKRTGTLLYAESLEDFEGRRHGCVAQ